jgi:hypothetical protein
MLGSRYKNHGVIYKEIYEFYSLCSRLTAHQSIF